MTKAQDTAVRIIISLGITFDIPVLGIILGMPWWGVLLMTVFGGIRSFAYWAQFPKDTPK